MTEYGKKLVITNPSNKETYEVLVKADEKWVFGDWPIPQEDENGITMPIRKTVISMHMGGKKDAMLESLESYWRTMLFKRNRKYYSTRSLEAGNSLCLSFEDCPILLERNGSGTLYVNGISTTVANCISLLARLTVKATREKETKKLMKYARNLQTMPENVTYALENRVPYTFWDNYVKHEVRLNLQLIGAKEVAIEVSDGVWGTISVKDLDSFVNAHRYGSKRSKWAFASPRKLYEMTVGKEPLESEIKVMKSFLLQNRTSELVESRARELVREMVANKPNRYNAEYDSSGNPTKFFIRGNHYDWMLQTKRTSASGRQDVSTYVYQNNEYSGPICIDNINSNSSIGDQIAGRALSLLNDNLTVNMVSTIKSYIKNEPNEMRDENNGLPRLQE